MKTLKEEVNFLERDVKGELRLNKKHELSELKGKIQNEKESVENCD